MAIERLTYSKINIDVFIRPKQIFYIVQIILFSVESWTLRAAASNIKELKAQVFLRRGRQPEVESLFPLALALDFLSVVFKQGISN